MSSSQLSWDETHNYLSSTGTEFFQLSWDGANWLSWDGHPNWIRIAMPAIWVGMGSAQLSCRCDRDPSWFRRDGSSQLTWDEDWVGMVIPTAWVGMHELGLRSQLFEVGWTHSNSVGMKVELGWWSQLFELGWAWVGMEIPAGSVGMVPFQLSWDEDWVGMVIPMVWVGMGMSWYGDPSCFSWDGSIPIELGWRSQLFELGWRLDWELCHSPKRIGILGCKVFHRRFRLCGLVYGTTINIHGCWFQILVMRRWFIL